MIRHGRLPQCFEIIYSHGFHRSPSPWHLPLLFRLSLSSLTTPHDIALPQASSVSPPPGPDHGTLGIFSWRRRKPGYSIKHYPSTYPEAMKVLSTIAQHKGESGYGNFVYQLNTTSRTWNAMISHFLGSCNSVQAGDLFEALSKTHIHISCTNLLKFIDRQAGVDNPGLAISILRYTKGMICYRTSPDFQRYLFLVLQRCDAEQAIKLYKALLQSCLKATIHTFLQFVEKFTLMGNPDLALDALGRVRASGSSMQRPAVQKSCVTLLRAASERADTYRIRSQIAARILELGVRPNITMLNAMILNCIEASDHDTMYGIFETIKINKLRRDSMTYSLIFKAIAQSLDESRLQETVNAAEEDGALPRNNTVVFCLLAAAFKTLKGRIRGPHDAKTIYLRMLHTYARYCDVEPLRELDIYVKEEVERCEPISRPSPQILGIMLVAYLASCAGRTSILPIYQRYQTLVKQNHALIGPIAETTHVANAFLLCMKHEPSTLTIYPMVLRNMIQPARTVQVRVARPGVHTWSIIASAYFFHGQKIAGEKIIEMMRASGIEPNQVSWNTIINGYAKLQDVDATVDAMHRMQAAGFEFDAYTHRSLAFLEDRERVLVALRKLPAASQNDPYSDSGDRSNDNTGPDLRMMRS